MKTWSYKCTQGNRRNYKDSRNTMVFSKNRIYPYYEKYKCDECEAKPESKPKLKPEPKPKPAPRPISPSLTGELPRKICL